MIKADGLAAGKGVTVALSLAEAEDALINIFKNKVFGSAGNEVVIEERNIDRKIKVNLCNCETCMRARVCLINYSNHEPKDNLEVMFKNAIDTACKKGKIYI